MSKSPQAITAINQALNVSLWDEQLVTRTLGAKMNLIIGIGAFKRDE